MSQDAKAKRVVVVGAGASGIGAARTLSAAGAEVIILEGRDRIGGRMRKHCLTKNLLNASGAETSVDHFVNIQLGANWIHGMEAATNPMFEVAQKLGLELHQTSSDDDPGDDVILFDSGDFKLADASDSDTFSKVGYSRVSKEDYHESLSRYEWIKEYVDHIQFNYEKDDISLQAAFDLALRASESEIFGPCPAAQRRCLNWMYDRVSIDLGAHISKVSLNCYAEGVSDGQGGEALVKHIGYSGILDHLATEFPLDIRLNRQVASIAVLDTAPSLMTEFGESAIFDHPSEEELEKMSADLQHCTLKNGHFVCITCTDGETFVADACIVTVPVGVLQAESISFQPRPPSVITSVCSSLKLGLMNLVWLWYPYVFWPEECNFLGVARDRDGDDRAEDNTIVKFSTFLVPPIFDNFGVRQPVLMCQIVGPYATTIESMSDADIAAEATATLRRMFGAQIEVPDALGCAHSQWGSDPMARGSWSYFPYRNTSNGYVNDASAVTSEGTASERVKSHLSIVPNEVTSSTSVPLGALLQSTRTTPARSPLRSVTISEAAATVYPVQSPFSPQTLTATTTAASSRTPRHYYSSDATGYTSEGTVDSDSTDSDDSDSEDSELPVANMYARHMQQDPQKGFSASSSDEYTRRSVDDIVSAHICYASEAMSVLNRGTVHGAYMSGIREATKILSFLDSAR